MHSLKHHGGDFTLSLLTKKDSTTPPKAKVPEPMVVLGLLMSAGAMARSAHSQRIVIFPRPRKIELS
ncbi:MAG: hypothetical protein WA883_04655 [Phormidesmis sp.]